MNPVTGQSDGDERRSVILVIDDNATNLRIVSEHLKEAGYQALVAQDGASGLEKARYIRPDLILLDVMMPGLNGFDTCRKMKEDDALKGIPVIFMTALSEVENKVRAFEAGGVDYLVKPFQPVEVMARIQMHLKLSELNEHLEQKVTQKTAELTEAVNQLQNEIAQRKVIEQERLGLLRSLQQNNKELQSIVYVSSHDLRSPMINIQGFSGELASKCKTLQTLILNLKDTCQIPEALVYLANKEIPDSLSFIEASTSRMKKLIDGLFDFSLISSVDLKFEKIDVEMLVKEISRSMSRTYQGIGVTIDCDRLPVCIGDEIQVGRVFTHLIDNAIKYHQPDKAPEVRISAWQSDGFCQYKIQDNGIGISPRYHEKIFEIFHQLNPETETEGVGMGLTICQSVLHRLNGDIQVQSEMGQGAVFVVSLPEK